MCPTPDEEPNGHTNGTNGHTNGNGVANGLNGSTASHDHTDYKCASPISSNVA